MTARLPNDRMVPGLIVVVGISSMVTQLITIREFLAQFQGNEFIIALIFFVWLVLGGMGVLLAGLVNKTSFRPRRDHLALLSLVLASLPPIEILAIRGLRDLVFLHGSSVGFYPTFAFIFTILAPYGLLLGLVLPIAIFVLREQTPDYPATRIYLADVLGNTAGALLFSFVLVHLVTPLTALFLSNLPILATIFFLFPPRSGQRLRSLIGVGLVFGVLLAGVFLEPLSLAPIKGRLVYYQESRYGRIEVQEKGGQNTLFVDGMPFSSNENLAMAEEAVHYPLSQVQDPCHILLISGQGGILKELQKYRTFFLPGPRPSELKWGVLLCSNRRSG